MPFNYFKSLSILILDSPLIQVCNLRNWSWLKAQAKNLEKVLSKILGLTLKLTGGRLEKLGPLKQNTEDKNEPISELLKANLKF